MVKAISLLQTAHWKTDLKNSKNSRVYLVFIDLDNIEVVKWYW
jgi:hypothetical protein